MIFMVRGFTFGGEESGVFSAAVESLPLVLKGKRSCFCQGEKSTVPSCVGSWDVGCLIDIWKLPIHTFGENV